MKRKILLIAILTIFLTLLVPIMNNSETMAAAKGDKSVTGVKYSSWSDSVKNKSVTIGGSFIGGNTFTYCIQHDKNVSFIDGYVTYKLQSKNISGADNDIINGLVYILSQESSYNRTEKYIVGSSSGPNTWWQAYGKDPVQLALWKYLYTYYDDLNDEFPITGRANLSISYNSDRECWVRYSAAAGENVYIENKYYNEYAKIYNTALEIAGANSEKNGLKNHLGETVEYDKSEIGKIYSAKVYLLTNAYNQNLMLVDSTDEDNVNVKLQFYKKDWSLANSLTKAKFSISAGTNVSITGGGTNLESTGSDGYIATITATPTSNTGTFTINIKETAYPHIGNTVYYRGWRFK